MRAHWRLAAGARDVVTANLTDVPSRTRREERACSSTPDRGPDSCPRKPIGMSVHDDAPATARAALDGDHPTGPPRRTTTWRTRDWGTSMYGPTQNTFESRDRQAEVVARAYPDRRDVFLRHAWYYRQGATKERQEPPGRPALRVRSVPRATRSQHRSPSHVSDPAARSQPRVAGSGTALVHGRGAQAIQAIPPLGLRDASPTWVLPRAGVESSVAPPCVGTSCGRGAGAATRRCRHRDAR